MRSEHQETTMEQTAIEHSADLSERAGKYRYIGKPAGKKVALLVVVATIILVVASISLVNLAFNSTLKQDKEPKAALSVAVVPASYRKQNKVLEINGSVEAWDPLAIGAEVNGLRIESVHCEEGQHVKAGQVLAELNSSVLRAQLEQERARLIANEAAYRKALQPNRDEDLNSWKAAVDQAESSVAQEEASLRSVKANSQNAQENTRRYQELRRVGAVSQMDADNAKTSALTAEAEVAAAERRVLVARFAAEQTKQKHKMAVSGGRQEDIQIAKSAMDEIRARIHQLEAQIAQTVVRTPSNGLVVKREAHIGEITAAGKVLFKIVRDDKLELRASVPEIDLHLISPRQKVAISTGMQSQSGTFTGVVREISPSVDPVTRHGMVKIDLPASPTIFSGMFLRGLVQLGEIEALCVPMKAVLNRDGKTVVFIRVGNKVVLREVRIAEPSHNYVEVIAGLKPGDEVVVAGAGFLKDGDIVTVVPQLEALPPPRPHS